MTKGYLKRRTDLQPGDMIIYPYVWTWQHDEGILAAEKRRPCMVIMRSEHPSGTLLGLIPITTKPIRDFSERMIVPYLERSAVGMNPDLPQSLAIRDCNVERLIPGGTNIRDAERTWTFSAPFLKAATQRFTEAYHGGDVRLILRTVAPEAEKTPAQTGIEI